METQLNIQINTFDHASLQFMNNLFLNFMPLRIT